MAIFKKREKPIDVTPKDLLEKMQTLEVKFEQTTKELDALKQNMRYAITKVGITRFNPFKEIGGDQSFSIALLNDHRNGVVMTSYYGRELNRIYAKSIRNGASEHELSTEEKNAISQAIGLENPKSKFQNSK